MKAILNYLNSAILPPLSHLRVGTVTRADFARHFHVYRRWNPDGANRSHDILRNMFDCAIAWSRRPVATGNPCKGIVRYRRLQRGRTLGANLRLPEDENPVCVVALRLFLLTGCRWGKIRSPHWCEVKPKRLAPTDAKSELRHDLLREPARELVDGLAERTPGEWTFPAANCKDQAP